MLRGWEKRTNRKAHEGTFWGDGIILDLSLGGGYMDVYNGPNSLKRTLKAPVKSKLSPATRVGAMGNAKALCNRHHLIHLLNR